MKPSSVIDAVATGKNIRMMLDKNDLTVLYLQDYIFNFGSSQAIYKWLRGASLPTIGHLAILAAVLGVSMDEIVVIDVTILSMPESRIITAKKDVGITMATAIRLLRAGKTDAKACG